MRTVASKVVRVGNVEVGNSRAITIQAKTNKNIQDIDGTIEQIKELTAVGCNMVHVEVSDMREASLIWDVKDNIEIPIIADISSSKNVAIEAIRAGADAICFDASKIKTKEIFDIASCAKTHEVAIQLSVQGDKPNFVKSFNKSKVKFLAESVLRQVQLIEHCGMEQIIIGIEASNAIEYSDICAVLDSSVKYPLCLCTREVAKTSKSCVSATLNLGIVLDKKIGDAIHVRFSSDVLEEVKIARLVLKELGYKIDNYRCCSVMHIWEDA